MEDDNRMREWLKVSDSDEISICSFLASYPYTLRPFGCLLKDMVLVETGATGEGLYKMI